jgi:hypothetical protein
MFVVPSFFGFQDAGKIVLDPDAAAFVARVNTAGGSLTSTEISGVNQLVIDLKGYSIWTKMKAIYPIVGASSAACAQNLKSSSFTGTFTSGWTFASTGVTPNGTSAYMDTGFLPSTNSTVDNVHLSFYSRTNNSFGSYPVEMGSEVANGSTAFALAVMMPADPFKGRIGGGVAVSYSNSNSSGFYTISRISPNNIFGQKNGTTQATNTTSQSFQNVPFNIWIGCLNTANSVNIPSNRQCAFASIGDGLSTTEASNFYTAVQAFQTTLSRQV